MAMALVSFFCLYYLMMVVLIIGWEGASRIKYTGTVAARNIKIAVIVPARNEEASIGVLLDDLQHQDHQDFEIIVVDDHSTDNTRQITLDAARFDHRIKILSNTNAGKKSALTTGIEYATAEIIVTTDADCRIQPGWLTIINQHFQDVNSKMLVGGVTIVGDKTLFHKAQSIEFASLIGSGVATLFFGTPTMCNGANLAFRKLVFHEVGGYSDTLHIPSGDDEFLLRKVHKKYPVGIGFMGTGDAVVMTGAQKTWNGFLHQRIRWAGKWRHNPTFSTTLLAIYVFLFQFITILLPGVVLTGILNVTQVLTLWSIKAFLELLFLKRTSSVLKSPWNWAAFLLLELTYPFYVVFIALICNFRSFTWKERRLRSGEEKTG